MLAERGVLWKVANTIVTLLLMVTAVSCSWNSEEAELLVQADSAIIQGNYYLADSLLLCYDSTNTDGSESQRAYKQLLMLERCYVDSRLTEAHLSMADSLMRYYDRKATREKHAKALLFLGEAYRHSGNYPSAISCCLKAESEAEDNSNLTLRIWISSQLGDIYFDQRMLPECTGYYQKQYLLALQSRDTLRMAYGAYSMALVSMIKNNVDSTLSYLQQAIAWGQQLSQRDKIVPAAKSLMADIYIQTKQFEQATAIMQRDSLNEYNWAYWHLGQQHVDSAVFYFQNLLSKRKGRAEVEYLRVLASLEEQRGNIRLANSYYGRLLSAEDSIRAASQADETQQAKAQYDYSLVRQERDAEAEHSRNLLQAMVLGAVGVALIGLISFFSWRSYKRKRDVELVHEKLLRKEEEIKRRQSMEQLADNMRRIVELERQLKQAKDAGNEALTEKLRLEAQLLDAENNQIKASQQRNTFLQRELEASELYVRIKTDAGKEGFHLSDKEWQQLAKAIDEAYNGFTSRLFSLNRELSEHELHICYLIRLHVSTTAIAVMLYRSKSAIGMARQRLYEKLTGKKGTAHQLNELIEQF